MKRLITLLVCLAAVSAFAEEEPAKQVVSPDKKWTYRAVETQFAIVRAETGEIVLKLGDEAMEPEGAKVLWAPDSRRFAYNYRSGPRYLTCGVYELTGTEWKPLPNLEENTPQIQKLISRAELRDRKRLGVTKSAHRRRIMDEWRVLRWIDRETFEALAVSSGSVVVDKESDDIDYIGGAVLFTAKCDNKGGWKITRMRELSDKEVEKLERDN